MGCPVLLDCPEEFRLKAEYTFDQIFTILGFSHWFVESTGDLGPQDLLILYTQESVRKAPARERPSRTTLTIPYRAEPFSLQRELLRNPPPRFLEEGIAASGLDLVKVAFHLLSRQEELEDPARDRFGRFQASQSLNYTQGLLRRPILNEYLVGLLNAVRRSGSRLLRKDFWPPPSRFSVCVSHDVDFKRKWGFRKTFREGRKALISSRCPRRLRELLGSIARSRKEDPYWNIDTLIELDRRFGVSSSFLFSSARTAKWDPAYSLTEGRIKEAFEKLLSQGFEVGLHGSFNSFTRPQGVLCEKRQMEKVLGRRVLGNRFHYLRFEVGKSWIEEEKAGLSYDMTLAYPDKLGFRAGVAFPYNPYDFQKEAKMNILELPPSISDGAILSEATQEPTSVPLDILARVRQTFGLLGLLWHPHTLDAEDFPALRGVYPAIMEWVVRNRAFATSGRDVCSWWQARQGLRVVEQSRRTWLCLPEQDLDLVGLELMGTQSDKVRVEGCEVAGSHKTEYGWYLELRGLCRRREIVVSSVP